MHFKQSISPGHRQFIHCSLLYFHAFRRSAMPTNVPFFTSTAPLWQMIVKVFQQEHKISGNNNQELQISYL